MPIVLFLVTAAMLCKITIKKNTNFRANTLRNIPEKFQQNLFSTFREEDFFKKLTSDGRQTDDRRTTDGRTTDGRRTQSDDKSSHCLRQGELKIYKPYTIIAFVGGRYDVIST